MERNQRERKATRAKEAAGALAGMQDEEVRAGEEAEMKVVKMDVGGE